MSQILCRLENAGLFLPGDMQRRLREKGMPWELSKGFDGSAAIGEWVDIGRFRDIQSINLRLDINGSTVQQACTGDMIFAVDELISYISKYFTLKTGDLIYTGTPAGTGPVAIGDRLEGWLDDRKVLGFSCR